MLILYENPPGFRWSNREGEYSDVLYVSKKVCVAYHLSPGMAVL
jgi:hypothetical protein